MSKKKLIKDLEEIEIEAVLFAQKCSKVRKQLLESEGSPAPRRGVGKLTTVQHIDLKNRRRKNLLRK